MVWGYAVFRVIYIFGAIANLVGKNILLEVRSLNGNFIYP